MAGLRWADVDFRWGKLTLSDKVDATRVIPLTPYLAQQLASLPRINAFVFDAKAAPGALWVVAGVEVLVVVTHNAQRDG